MIRLFRKTYSNEHPWVATELLTDAEHAWMYTAGKGMPPYEGSTRNFSLMEEDNIIVNFSLTKPVLLGVGDFFIDDTFGLFEVTEAVKPTYNADTAGYDYNVTAEAQYRGWKNKLMRLCYPLQDGSYHKGETAFSLTDTIANHAAIIVNNANATGIRYCTGISDDGVPQLDDYIVQIDITDGTQNEMRYVSYDGVNLLDALDAIAEAWECEWWFVGNVLHFGHCENETDEENRPQWVLGDNMESMEQEKGQEKFCNRLYVLGGTKNIPHTYRKTATFTIQRVWSAEAGSEDGEDRGTRYYFYELDKPVRPEYFRSEQKNVYRATSVNNSTSENGGIIPLITFKPKNSGYYYLRLTNIRIIVFRGVNYEIDSDATGTVQLVHKDMALTPIYKDVGGAVGVSGVSSIDGSEFRCAYGNSMYANYLSLRVTLDDTTSLKAITVACDAVVVESPAFARDIKVGNLPVACNPFRKPIGNEQYTAIAVYSNNVREDWAVGKSFAINNEYIDNTTMPGSYFDTQEKGNGVSSYVDYAQTETRLQLPTSHGLPYVDAVDGLKEWQVFEDKVTYDDIFPKQKNWTIGIPRVVEDDPSGLVVTEYSTGETTTKYLPVYYVRHSEFEGLNDGDSIPTTSPYVFLEDYLLQGEELRVKFEVGATLGGMSFAAVFNPYKAAIKNDDGTYNAGAQWFKLIPNEDYGRRLPDEVGRPKENDPFILTGFNSEAITSLGLVGQAEAELLAKAKEEVAKRYRSEGTSTCHLMSDYAAAVGAGEFITADGFNIITADGFQFTPKSSNSGIDTLPFGEGMQVRIYNPAVFGNEGKVLRIIGYEIKLDFPWDSPIFVAGESKPYSRLRAIEKTIKKTN